MNRNGTYHTTNVMPEECNICVYQPYYKSKGHFSDYFDRLAIYLQSYTKCTIHGVAESDGSPQYPENIRLYTFEPTLKSKKRSVLNNLDALFTLHQRVPACNIYHFLDAELFILFFYLAIFGNKYRQSTLVVTQHSTNSYQNSHGKRIYSWFIQFVYKMARKKLQICFITNGRAIGEDLQQFFGVPAANIHLSEWGAETIDTNIDTDTYEPKTPNSVLMTGMLRSDKGLELLARVLPDIDHPMKLTIAGYPADYTASEIQDMFSSLPDHIDVDFQLSYLSSSAFHRLMTSNEFLIIPYKPQNKSSSGPLVQGLLHGMIPIVSNYGERGRIVNEYASGISFDYTEHSLKKALQRALKMTTESKRAMVLDNLKLTNTFSWDSIFKEYAGAYERWSGSGSLKKRQ